MKRTYEDHYLCHFSLYAWNYLLRANGDEDKAFVRNSRRFNNEIVRMYANLVNRAWHFMNPCYPNTLKFSSQQNTNFIVLSASFRSKMVPATPETQGMSCLIDTYMQWFAYADRIAYHPRIKFITIQASVVKSCVPVLTVMAFKSMLVVLLHCMIIRLGLNRVCPCYCPGHGGGTQEGWGWRFLMLVEMKTEQHRVTLTCPPSPSILIPGILLWSCWLIVDNQIRPGRSLHIVWLQWLICSPK